MTEDASDLTVMGPGSPFSLQKFINSKPDLRKFTILVDGTGFGIAKDAPEYLYVTPETRKMQARYYCDELFTGSIPAYLFRYLHWMFSEYARKEMKYPTDADVIKAFEEGTLTKESSDYIFVKNLITCCDNNPEAEQLIGMIQILAGTLNMARKHGTGIKIYIEHPEHALHPARQSAFVNMFMKIQDEYGLKETTVVGDTGPDAE